MQTSARTKTVCRASAAQRKRIFRTSEMGRAAGDALKSPSSRCMDVGTSGEPTTWTDDSLKRKKKLDRRRVTAEPRPRMGQYTTTQDPHFIKKGKKKLRLHSFLPEYSQPPNQCSYNSLLPQPRTRSMAMACSASSQEQPEAMELPVGTEVPVPTTMIHCRSSPFHSAKLG
jgi:hypothetical protein